MISFCSENVSVDSKISVAPAIAGKFVQVPSASVEISRKDRLKSVNV